MEFRTGEIQPVSPEAWAISEPGKKEVRAVPPVIKAEGGSARQIGGKQDNQELHAAQANPEYVAKLVKKLQTFLDQTLNVSLDFRVEEQTGEMVVRVLNRDTGEVVRQIPAEEILKLHEKMDELRGALFNGKV
jgi:flagellar protein FlaG